jgi:H2-forming N5,N10-methylenetetrahydromethanopterin dehydrogenase-like enzyme
MTDHITNSRCVKFLVGLKLAQRGFRETALVCAVLRCSPEHYYNVLACRERSARLQAGIARLCACPPVEIFGQFTHRSLLKAGRKESA